MSYTQIRPFNQAQGGTTPNMCLANTTKGYGIPNRYASAWEAWQNTEQHAGSAPAGLDVPVYFSYSATIDGIYKNWGHIGVRLANGQFWSDGKVYSSIEAYTVNHAPRYVGWGESVNNGTVIKEGEDMGRIQELEQLANDRQQRLNAIGELYSVPVVDGNTINQVIANAKAEKARIDELTRIVGELENRPSDAEAQKKLQQIKEILK